MSSEVPGLFFVDEGTAWEGDLRLRRPGNRPTRLRAVTLDGRELWEYRFTGRLVRHVDADQRGGVVIVRASGVDGSGPGLCLTGFQTRPAKSSRLHLRATRRRRRPSVAFDRARLHARAWSTARLRL